MAVHGTRIKAVSNRTRNFTRASLAKFIQDADEKLAGYMKRLDEGDADEERTSGGGSGGADGKLAEKIAAIQGNRDRHKEMLAELNRRPDLADRSGRPRDGAHDQGGGRLQHPACRRREAQADRRAGGEQ
ncbi:hypothetical protein SPHINGOT1_80034 [Sphingomonas sp. T1]|nr:hypothetical protein SPHINGOT1_80034 [Sphingomonas sp. T1]